MLTAKKYAMTRVIGIKLRLISATTPRPNSATVSVLIVQKSFMRNFIRVIEMSCFPTTGAKASDTQEMEIPGRGSVSTQLKPHKARKSPSLYMLNLSIVNNSFSSLA